MLDIKYSAINGLVGKRFAQKLRWVSQIAGHVTFPTFQYMYLLDENRSAGAANCMGAFLHF